MNPHKLYTLLMLIPFAVFASFYPFLFAFVFFGKAFYMHPSEYPTYMVVKIKAEQALNADLRAKLLASELAHALKSPQMFL